ncbi:hypothetical protein Q8A73_001502 [Channa argus]|nr:hypothetical protein Q8A73_001502 [Channa argus]
MAEGRRRYCLLPSLVRLSGEHMAYGQKPTPHSSPSLPLPCLHRFGGAPPHGMARDCCVPPLLQKVKEELSKKAERRTTWVLWGGMAYMATQFGILARLTWWEYSWDIMEPVTYFITYGTAMAMYAYFVLTRQEYIYPDARDRQYLLFLHKGVKRTRFDIEKYNKLKDDIAEVELDLKRLRDPLQLQLPIQQLTDSKN